jgi:hypothetical protein
MLAKLLLGMPNPEMDGVMRRLRWIIGLAVYDWNRERWVTREDVIRRLEAV